MLRVGAATFLSICLEVTEIVRIFAGGDAIYMEKSKVIDRIRRVAQKTLPPNSSLLLYGSRARGDSHDDSDWDILILLDKQELEARDYAVAYPFRELGWEIGEEVNPSLYTKKQWTSWSYLPYYKNVERDKIVIV